MSTPVKPPGSHDFCIWNAMTESTATARKPSMSGRYSNCDDDADAKLCGTSACEVRVLGASSTSPPSGILSLNCRSASLSPANVFIKRLAWPRAMPTPGRQLRPALRALRPPPPAINVSISAAAAIASAPGARRRAAARSGATELGASFLLGASCLKEKSLELLGGPEL
jgi:hypothetical protein